MVCKKLLIQKKHNAFYFRKGFFIIYKDPLQYRRHTSHKFFFRIIEVNYDCEIELPHNSYNNNSFFQVTFLAI